jgi:hypothetical protein
MGVVPEAFQHIPSQATTEARTRSDRIRAFRIAQKAGVGRKTEASKAIHLLSGEEVHSLFTDVTSGLAFLVGLLVDVPDQYLTLLLAREVDPAS